MQSLLRALFDTAVAAADPRRLLAAQLPQPPRGAGRTVVVGAGKAAATMAEALEAAWPGPLQGLVVTRDGHGAHCRRIEVVESSHPVPDTRGVAAATRMLQMVVNLNPDDLVIALISGGGSAVLGLPAGPATLPELAAVTQQLLTSGAPISDINVVRKHVSAIAGGRLALAAAPARLVTLAISDVPGDDPSTIASGPTVADPSSLADARAVLAHYGIAVPPGIAARLADPAAETPKPGALAAADFRIIASPAQSLDAAAALARHSGYAVHSLGDRIEGEARAVARDHARLAGQIADGGGPVRPPCVLLSGGETTVTVRGHGRGGRNSEYALALALALDGRPGIGAIAGDTDGIDGSGDNAGATVLPDALDRMRERGIDPQHCLEDNNAYAAFAAIGGLIVTGPTRTNVNDFRAIVIESPTAGMSAADARGRRS